MKKHGYRVFTKVRMSDLLVIPKGTQNQQSYWNKIQGKSVDFVICNGNFLSPLFVIELGNSTSGKNEFVEKAFYDAGLPIIRLTQQQTYTEDFVQQKISPVLSRIEPAPSKQR